MMRPIVQRVIAYAQAMGLDMIEGDYEDTGQLELNFQYDRCERYLRPAGHLPAGLLAGGARVRGGRELHAQAARRLDGKRLPPQPQPVA